MKRFWLFGVPSMLVLLGLPWGARAQILIIAHPSAKTAEISRAQLRDLFNGTTTLLPGFSQAVPVMLKEGTIEEQFLNLYVGKSDAAFRTSWRSLVFSGQAVMPRSVDTEAAMVQYVARTPGAVGFIEVNTPHEGVKILSIR